MDFLGGLNGNVVSSGNTWSVLCEFNFSVSSLAGTVFSLSWVFFPDDLMSLNSLCFWLLKGTDFFLAAGGSILLHSILTVWLGS